MLHCPATLGSAGHDVASSEDVTIEPGQIKQIHTGIRITFEQDLVVLLRDRSGLGSRGLHILAGVIDSDYRGEWIVVACNLGTEAIVIKDGDKVAQAIFVKYYLHFDPMVRIRGQKGFGSTDHE